MSTIVKNAFKLYDTHGLPLVMIINAANSRGAVIAWFDFILDAIIAGWQEKKIRATMEDAICDSCGKDYWIEVEKRMDIVFNGIMP